MRDLFVWSLVGWASCSVAVAQDGLSIEFEGRAGMGYLSHETLGGFGGFQYIGLVLRAEGTGRLEYRLSDEIVFGAIAQLSTQKGNKSNYELLSFSGATEGLGSKFDASELDMAIYVGLPLVTLSYGEMETAFDFATLEIGQGGSILDGGSAVWMNLGDGSGSASGSRNQLQPDSGPPRNMDLRTLRADVILGDFTFSASKSKFDWSARESEAAGLIWRGNVGEAEVFVGGGYEQGPDDRFRSFSFGATVEGLSVVFNKIRRTPRSGDPVDIAYYDTEYMGYSIAYDAGALTLGFSSARQNNTRGSLFDGDAEAIWGSWEARENVTVDVEFSESDFGPGKSTKKASVAVALKF